MDPRPRLVLVVEDDEKSRRLLHDVLAWHGFEVLSSASGEQGLEAARARAPDAALVDVHLPGIDGYEVLAALRAQPGQARLPVIAVTASAMDHDRARMLASGFNACITKPVNIEQLIDTLKALIEAA